MPVCTHIGSSSRLPYTSDDAPPLVVATLPSFLAASALADWFYSGLFVRHPGPEAVPLGGRDRVDPGDRRAGRLRVRALRAATQDRHRLRAHRHGVGGRGRVQRRARSTSGRASCSATTCSAASSTTGTARRRSRRSGSTTSWSSATTPHGDGELAPHGRADPGPDRAPRSGRRATRCSPATPGGSSAWRTTVGEVLGLGMTHFPPLGWPDEPIEPRAPVRLRRPDACPRRCARARAGPTGSARSSTVPARRPRPTTGPRWSRGARRCAPSSNAFAPDVVVIWGDDQYELLPRGRGARVLRGRHRDADVRAVAAARRRSGPQRVGRVARHRVRGPGPRGVRSCTSPRRCSTTTSTSPTRTDSVPTGRSRTPSPTRSCSSTTTASASRTRSCR